MHFHYRQNRLYFLRFDLWSIPAFILSVAGGIWIIEITDGHIRWYTAVSLVLLFAVAVTAFVVMLSTSRKAYIDACAGEAYRLSCAETAALYHLSPEETRSVCCFLRIAPPKGRRTARRKRRFSCAYTVSLLQRGEKLIFEIRGVSLVSTEIYRKTVRVLLSEVRSVSFEPNPRRGDKRGTVVVTGSDGQTLFSCRCQAGHPAQDFLGFIRARIS